MCKGINAEKWFVDFQFMRLYVLLNQTLDPKSSSYQTGRQVHDATVETVNSGRRRQRRDHNLHGQFYKRFIQSRSRSTTFCPSVFEALLMSGKRTTKYYKTSKTILLKSGALFAVSGLHVKFPYGARSHTVVKNPPSHHGKLHLLITYFIFLPRYQPTEKWPFLSNIIVCTKSAKITLSISDHSAGIQPLNFINIPSQAWAGFPAPCNLD